MAKPKPIDLDRIRRNLPAETAPEAANFIVALAAAQKELGVSDAAFAERIGTSQTLYSRTKGGTYPLGQALVAAARSLVPVEVYLQATFFLAECIRKRMHSRRKLMAEAVGVAE